MTGAVEARGRSMPGPGFELSVTAGSPVPHVYLGQQTAGLNSDRADWKPRREFFWSFKANDARNH